jgi:hypothetical protein
MSELKKKDSNDPVEVAMDYGVCNVENGSSISYKSDVASHKEIMKKRSKNNGAHPSLS